MRIPMIVLVLLVSFIEWLKEASDFPDRGASEGGAPAAPPEPFKPKLYTDPFWNGFGSSFDEQTEFIGDPDGEPFAVTIRGSNYIPVSVLIFAASEEDAKERVLSGVRKIIAKREAEAARNADSPHYEYIYVGALKRAQGILELAESGNIQAEPFDRRCLAKAVWAGNDELA